MIVETVTALVSDTYCRSDNLYRYYLNVERLRARMDLSDLSSTV